MSRVLLSEGAKAKIYLDNNVVVKVGYIGPHEAEALRVLGPLGIAPELFQEGPGGIHMEYVEGTRMSPEPGVWEPLLVLRAAKALALAHQHGWAHGDLHAGNIVWRGDEAVFLDWGASCPLAEDPDALDWDAHCFVRMFWFKNPVLGDVARVAYQGYRERLG